MFRIRLRFDPFHFGQPDPGSKKSDKIMENFQKKSTKMYIIYFKKNINLLFNGQNIYLLNNKTNHFLEKYIFDRKKGEKKVGIFFILDRIWSRIRYSTKRIWIPIKMKRIRNTGINNNIFVKKMRFCL